MRQSDSAAAIAWDIPLAVLAVSCGLAFPLYAVYPDSTGFVPALSLAATIAFAADAFRGGAAHHRARRHRVADTTEHGLSAAGSKAPGLLSTTAACVAAIPGPFIASRLSQQAGLALLLCFLPLLKLVSVNATIRRIGDRVINPAILRLCLLVFWILLAAHVIACLWIIVSGNPSGLAPFDRYVRSFYWTVTTITTIGYGDIVPTGTGQTVFVIAVEIVGAAMYGLVIGSIAGLIANIDVAKRQYRERLERINAFLRYRDVPRELLRKVDAYYAYLWETRKGYNELEFIHDLPAALKESVALFLNRDLIARVPLFEKASPTLIRDIILKLEPVVYTPGDYIVRAGEIGRDMFFISRGSVSVVSEDESITYATLSSGQYFGEISLLLSVPRTATIKADGFCDLYRLEKDQFDLAISRYPAFKESIRVLAAKRREEVEAKYKNT